MFRTESLFFHNGYKCVVVFTYLGHRCGYVAVTPDNPLFKIDYSQDLKSPELLQEINSSTIGKRSIVDLFCWNGEDVTLSMLVNVHGGLTFSNMAYLTNYPTNQVDKVWYFGFDCAHYGDAPDVRTAIKYFTKEKMEYLLESEKKYPSQGTICTLEYCEQECRNLADQLECIKETIIQTRIKLD